MARALYQKLGIKEDLTISVINPPREFERFFDDVPFKLEWVSPSKGVNFIHFFPKNTKKLEESLPKLQDLIHKDGIDVFLSVSNKGVKLENHPIEDAF